MALKKSRIITKRDEKEFVDPSIPATVREEVESDNHPLLDGVNHENEDVVDITIISGGVE